MIDLAVTLLPHPDSPTTANVDPASTAQVANALIAGGKRFELISVPGGGHLLGRTSGPVDYVKSRMYDFFIRHLQGQPAAGG